jgi:ribonuclease T1
LSFQGKPVFWTGSDPSSVTSNGGLRRALHKWGCTVVVAAGLAAGGVAPARTADAPAGTPGAVVALADLPPQAQQTHRLILAGGPFPYQKDGVVFVNRERLLPPKDRGWYREYTVKTPGARNRGARRIVCGGVPPTKPEACFYTDDHYASFKRISPERTAP